MGQNDSKHLPQKPLLIHQQARPVIEPDHRGGSEPQLHNEINLLEKDRKSNSLSNSDSGFRDHDVLMYHCVYRVHAVLWDHDAFMDHAAFKDHATMKHLFTMLPLFTTVRSGTTVHP